MLRSMLVVLDGSPPSEPVIALAFDWATRFHARVRGLGVLDAPSIEHGEPVPMGAYAYKKHRDEVRLAEAHRRVMRLLDDFRARSAAAGIDATTVEDVGDPAEQILREGQRCDVVLLARETRFALEADEAPDRTLNHVIRRLPRPAVVVPAESRDGHRRPRSASRARSVRHVGDARGPDCVPGADGRRGVTEGSLFDERLPPPCHERGKCGPVRRVPAGRHAARGARRRVPRPGLQWRTDLAYLGKQVTAVEMKLIALYAVIGPFVVLPLTALAAVSDVGLAGLTTNKGPHGLSEILVAYTTSMANNGQNFAGLSANTPFYNVTTPLAMMAGRFGLAIPALVLAGRFAQQTRKPVTDGTFPTDTLLFAGLVIATVLLVGALSYLPVLALGPVVEHLALSSS